MRTITRSTPLVLSVLIGISLILSAAPTVHAQDTRSATILRTDYEFERNGVRFFIDLAIDNMQGQEAFITLWFFDSGDDYLANDGWGDDYEDTEGNLAVWEIIEPTSNAVEYSRAAGHSIALFVPFSQFPSVDYNYSYTPYVSVQAVSDGSRIGAAWMDDTLRVLGGESEPFGYQVWMSVRGITANDIQENGFLEDGEDELMLTYMMTEVTPDGYAGGYDMYAWSNVVTDGQQVSETEFPWLYIDVAATSDVVLWMELTEVDDYTAAQEYIGAVNATVGGVGLVTYPFLLAPPYAAGVALAGFISGVADITVNLIALLDPNDPLGDPQLVLEPDNLRGIMEYEDGWYSSYEFWSDYHNYDLQYSVYIQPYYRHQPIE